MLAVSRRALCVTHARQFYQSYLAVNGWVISAIHSNNCGTSIDKACITGMISATSVRGGKSGETSGDAPYQLRAGPPEYIEQIRTNG